GSKSRHMTQDYRGLQHLRCKQTDRLDLPEVVHHADELEARLVGGSHHGRQVRAQPGRGTRPGVVGDLEPQLQGWLAANSSMRWMTISVPRWKLSRTIRSFGEWAPSSSPLKPETKRWASGSAATKSGTTGME